MVGLTGGTISAASIITSLVTLAVIIVASFFAKGILKTIPILLGIVVGYVVACFFGLVNIDPIREAPWFALPNFQLPFVSYVPNWAGMLLILPIGLISICEHLGDIAVYSEITGQNTYKNPGLHRTILGDGLATLVAGLLGSCVNTSYGEYTSTVAISKVASVSVLILTSVFAIAFAFIGKFGALIGSIPNAVLGAACLILYGFISGNGLKTLINNKVQLGNTKNMIIVSLMLVLGLGGASIGIATGSNIISVSGMSLATIIGIVLNLILKEKENV
jgi:uracil permease